MEPNPVSEKALNTIRGAVSLLRAEARFRVSVNAILGSGPLEETVTLVRQMRSWDLPMTIGIPHAADGALERGLLRQDGLAAIYDRTNGIRRRTWLHTFGEGWEREMVRTGQSDWKCRAGGRYLYVDEAGLVSFCSQRRGQPGIPLSRFRRSHCAEFAARRKGCEPTCTISCARRASAFDRWRPQRDGTPSHGIAGATPIPDRAVINAMP